MYDNYVYRGRKLKEWAVLLHHEFSVGELYRMAMNGVDFCSVHR